MKPADVAGAAGDQDRAVGVDGACPGRGGDAGEPLGQNPVAAEGELGLVVVEGRGGRPVEEGVVVDVDEDEPSGVFGLGGADETAGGRDGKVVDVLVATGGDGAVGEQDEAGAGQALVGEPGPEQRQRVEGGAVGVGDGVGGFRGAVGSDEVYGDRFRCGCAAWVRAACNASRSA